MEKIKVSAEQVKHVGTLARLDIESHEIQAYQNHLQKILDYARELNEVKTDGVEPLFSPVYEYLDHYKKEKTYLREDKIQASLENEELLKNAPDKSQGQFRLNAVITEE